MEFFKQVDLDWMGKAKYFFALSITLLVVGGISLIVHRGPYYGVDFKGGTVVYVRFAGTPPVDKIRTGLAQVGLGESVIQPISDIASSNSNEVMIQLEEKGSGFGSSGHRQERDSERSPRHPRRGRTRQAGFQRRRRVGHIGCPDAERSP